MKKIIITKNKIIEEKVPKKFTAYERRLAKKELENNLRSMNDVYKMIHYSKEITHSLCNLNCFLETCIPLEDYEVFIKDNKEVQEELRNILGDLVIDVFNKTKEVKL